MTDRLAKTKATAERQFVKAQRAVDAGLATQEYATAAQALLDKTHRLRALRLAKEAAERAAAPKPQTAAERRAASRRRTAARKA